VIAFEGGFFAAPDDRCSCSLRSSGCKSDGDAWAGAESLDVLLAGEPAGAESILGRLAGGAFATASFCFVGSSFFSIGVQGAVVLTAASALVSSVAVARCVLLAPFVATSVSHTVSLVAAAVGVLGLVSLVLVPFAVGAAFEIRENVAIA
jgi:hypothetical protein